MKKQTYLKSIYRIALVALCLMTAGVGEMWGGNRRVYCYYGHTTWWNGGKKMCLHAWGSSTLSSADFEMEETGIDNLLYYDLDESYTSLCFFRADEVDISKKYNQTVDITIGTNNRWEIWNDTDNGNQKVGAMRWVNGAAIDGLLDPLNPHKQAFNEKGEFSVSLTANTAYEFKVLDNITLYGCGTRDHDYTYVGQTDSVLINTSSGNKVMLLTATGGTYTFGWCSSTKKLKITYPDAPVKHPNMNYVYMEKYSDWNEGTHTYIHYWYTGTPDVGLTDGGVDPKMTISFTAKSPAKTFYTYPVLTDYPHFKVAQGLNGDGGSGSHATSNMEVTNANKGHYVWHNGSGWVWATFQVYIKLENQGADEGKKGTLGVPVAFNDTALSTRINKPIKSHYDFGGYYTAAEGGGVQIIDANGDWKQNVSDYTSSGAWIHAGDTTTLYAKWTQTAYTITPVIVPEGAGTVNTVTDAHFITPSSTIIADSANAAWVFDHWVCGDQVGFADGSGNTDRSIQVTAGKNSTITAYFKPRYDLVGSLYDNGKEKGSRELGGMPGWTYGSSNGDFTFNSFAEVDASNANVDLTFTCTLVRNGTYTFLIHDRASGESMGLSGSPVAAITIENNTLELVNQDCEVFLYPSLAAGKYTFKITHMRKDGGKYYPTVTMLRPQQVNFGTGYAGIDNLSSVTSGTTGGTLVVDTADTEITTGTYVTYGADVTYTPSAATGYTFEGFYTTNTYSSRFTQDNPWLHENVTSEDNAYAKFTEDSKSVTISKTGSGTITVGGSSFTWDNSTTCGVTTTRRLVATGSPGYRLSSWTVPDGVNFQLEDKASDTDNDVTLRGKASGSAGTLTANFTERWSIKGTMNGENWGTDHKISNIGTNASSKDTGYVEISLPANTTYKFSLYDLANSKWIKNGADKEYTMDYGNHTNWDFRSSRTYDCGITTAGAGTYKFIFNITDTTVTVVYPTSYLVNLGMKAFSYEGTELGGVECTVTAVDGSSVNYANGSYIARGATVYVEATSIPTGYQFVEWHSSSSYDSPFSYTNPASWEVIGPVNAYAKITEVTNTFEGDVEGHLTEWNQTGNWSAGHVPTINEVAILPKPVSVEIDHAVAKRVIIDQNSHTGKLTIQANMGLELTGTISKTTDGSSYGAPTAADLVLESSSAGNASLIFDNSNSAQATVQMYSKAIIDGETWNWQFMGTPFTSANALYSYYGSYLYEWKESNGMADWAEVPNGGTMNPFTGYCITQDAATTYVMDGTLNPTTSKVLSVPANVEMVFANSWTAPIYVGTITDKALAVKTKTIYLFNTGHNETGIDTEGEEAGTYRTLPIHAAKYTGDSLIAPMQGFYVDNTGGSAGTVTLDYATVVRPTGTRNDIVAGPMHAPKRTQEQPTDNRPTVLKMWANGALYNDRVVLLEREGFSTGFDNGWDGKKLNFGEVGPSVYVINTIGEAEAVSAIPDLEGTVIGFRAGTNNTCTMTFEYDGEDIFYLNDLQAQQSARIDNETSYSFATNATDNEARFVISKTPIAKTPTDIEPVTDNPSPVTRKILLNDHIYIIRDGRIYNVDGLLVK